MAEPKARINCHRGENMDKNSREYSKKCLRVSITCKQAVAAAVEMAKNGRRMRRNERSERMGNFAKMGNK